mgnify:CR=1 FL=1|tara:strand:+ start:2732 stop:7423 length:4692 start_codon:yes stop_codon:yes gene_type:complete
MAEQSPVIVNEDKNNAPAAVPTGAQDNLQDVQQGNTQQSNAVADNQKAEFVGFATPSEALANKTDPQGRQVIRVDPVEIKPRPKAGVENLTGVDVESIIPPRVKFKTLEAEAEAAVKKSESPSVSYDQAIAAMERGETIEFNTPTGTKKYVPQVLPAIKSNAEIQAVFKGHAVQDAYLRDRDQPEPFIMGTDPSRTKVDLSGIQDPSQGESVTEYAENRIRLNNELKKYVDTGNPSLDTAVRQYFVDDFDTGDFFSSLDARLFETANAPITLPTLAGTYAKSFVETIRRVSEKGTPFPDEWANLAEQRMDDTKLILGTIDTYLGPTTIARTLNDNIRKRAKLEFDEGRLTEEQYNNFIYTTDLTGERMEREFISEEAGYALTEAAFKELGYLSQGGVIFAENFLTGGAFGITRNAMSRVYINELKDMRKTFQIPSYVRLSEIPSWAKANGHKLKVNENLLEIGLGRIALKRERLRADRRRKDLAKQIEAKNLELKHASIDKRGPIQLEIDRMEAERDNIGRSIVKNWIQSTISPSVLKIAGDDVVLSAGAWAGSTYLEGFMGMDRETAELAGFAGTLITKNPLMFLGKGTARFTKNLISDAGIRNPAPVFMRKLTLPDLSMEDYERLYFEPENGRRMTFSERRAARAAFKQVDRMSPDERLEFREAFQKQQDLKDEILAGFPESRRKEAAKFFELTMAEATGLAPMIGMYQTISQTFSFKRIKKEGIGGVARAIGELDDQASKASVALKNFEEYVAKYADASSTESLTNLVATSRSSLVEVNAQIEKEYLKLEGFLNEVVDAASADTTANLPENFFEQVVEVQKMIAKRVPDVNMEDAARTVANAAATSRKMNRGLLLRLRQILSLRDNKEAHLASLESSAEAITNARYGALSEMMDETYDGFRDFMNAREKAGEVLPTIDISESVEEMLRISGEKQITDFFGAEATFFSGYLGNKARTMFESMVDRTLKGIDEEALPNIVQELKDAGVPADKLDDMIKNDPIRFGLLLHQHGGINIFAKASMLEAEEMRKAFRDYGYKVDKPAVARNYKQYEEILNRSMRNADETGFKELKKARLKYQSLNDPLRPGNPLQKISQSRTGEKVDIDSGPYSGMYRNKTPYEILSETGVLVNKIMAGGQNRPILLSQLRKATSQLEQLFGEVGPDGTLGFNLDTVEGREAFLLVKSLTEEMVFSEWARGYIKPLQVPGKRVTTGSVDFRNTAQGNLESVTPSFSVRTFEGNRVRQEPLLDIVNLVEREQDISRVIEKGQKYHERGKTAVKAILRKVKEVKGQAQISKKVEVAGMETLLRIANVSNSQDFFDKFIQGPEDLDTVRDLFIQTIKRDPTVNVEDVEKVFDKAVYGMTYQAILKVGEYRATGVASAAATVQGFNGESIVIKQFGNTLGALDAITDENVRRNLLKVMPEEQVNYMESILKYLVNQEGMRVASEGMARGMSANEAISRAYNIAREMVSPAYIASEVAVKLMHKNSADAFFLAMQSKDAARIMDKMLHLPETVTARDLKTFELLLIEFVATDVARKGQEEALTEYFKPLLGEESTNEEEES